MQGCAKKCGSVFVLFVRKMVWGFGWIGLVWWKKERGAGIIWASGEACARIFYLGEGRNGW